MKKIFTGIIIIVSSFLFYDIYNKYQTTHEDNLYGIDSINNKFNNKLKTKITTAITKII